MYMILQTKTTKYIIDLKHEMSGIGLQKSWFLYIIVVAYLSQVEQLASYLRDFLHCPTCV